MLFPQLDLVDVYQPRHLVDEDKNVLPMAVELVGTGIKCSIHRGVQQARDMALSIGVTADNPSLCYFQPDARSLLKDRGVLIEPDGTAWLIHGLPAYRPHFASTAHVRCLISFLAPHYWPEGLPTARNRSSRTAG